MTIDGVLAYRDIATDLSYLADDFIIPTNFFNYRLNRSDNNFTCFVVPEGFRTDGASIPKLARRFCFLAPRDKEIYYSAIGHDYLYKYQEVTIYEYDPIKKKKGVKIDTIKLTRNECDLFIMYDMSKLGANTWQRVFTYLGLLIGGWYGWNKAKRLLIKK